MTILTMTKQQHFQVKTCPECGVEYALTQEFNDERYKNGGRWYCPNGHSLVFRTTELDLVRSERDRLKQDNARLEDDARAAWLAQARENAVRRQAEAALKKSQKRIGAGVCPCCNRSFVALARHMKAKHPEVAPLNALRA